ncbi:tetraspanin-4-like [Portunus trituberculatus]|uniref:tetraspanin-4-like n=1 Tax=Portunus trituberculatus TaxID=210409 RepID=UPI001E1D1FFA|nr:tetraspanin-4-like [Portunus trituberculatus]
MISHIGERNKNNNEVNELSAHLKLPRITSKAISATHQEVAASCSAMTSREDQLIMAVAKYIAFATFIIMAGTGIALGYTGASLLSSYVAYLSPWVPVWLWLAVGSVMVLGVMITAISTVGAISTLAPNPKGFKMCLSLLLMAIVTEMGTTVLVYQKKALFLNSLSLHMKQEMEVSEAAYGANISDTQMWDEIQLEMNCCGTEDYEDWFDTAFGNGTDVPDSCCLLISEGCGKGIKNDVTPEDDIETEGCLPTLIDDFKRDAETLSRGVWLPVCAMHVALFVLLLATSVFLHEGYTDSNFRLYSTSDVLPSPTRKYKTLVNDC